MQETSYYPEMTVGLLKRLLKEIPDDVIVNIMNNEGKDTANIELLYIKGGRFNDFLNKYRIEYITKKINKTYLTNFTMEAIANEAGFASKSSFNLAFKKFNQCTPTEYLSKQL